MAKALDGKNYQLVITGHSLGAGTAALIGLKLKDRFPGGSIGRNAVHISAEVACLCRAVMPLRIVSLACGGWSTGL